MLFSEAHLLLFFKFVDDFEMDPMDCVAFKNQCDFMLNLV